MTCSYSEYQYYVDFIHHINAVAICAFSTVIIIFVVPYLVCLIVAYLLWAVRVLKVRFPKHLFIFSVTPYEPCTAIDQQNHAQNPSLDCPHILGFSMAQYATWYALLVGWRRMSSSLAYESTPTYRVCSGYLPSVSLSTENPIAIFQTSAHIRPSPYLSQWELSLSWPSTLCLSLNAGFAIEDGYRKILPGSRKHCRFSLFLLLLQVLLVLLSWPVWMIYIIIERMMLVWLFSCRFKNTPHKSVKKLSNRFIVLDILSQRYASAGNINVLESTIANIV